MLLGSSYLLSVIDTILLIKPDVIGIISFIKSELLFEIILLIKDNKV
jgi:hypothetical protein